ncbi:MAG: VOC family protein [Bryobacterales bacterium]|nr:VOC family protein [Bryobacterales bacterium]MBV9398115.1 VOC family protein [Bryobacterales bacterium]
MHSIISNLLHRFDRGSLTRRELAEGLSILAAAAATGSVAQAQDSGLKATKVDHVSIQVTDLPRAIAFYQKTFGLAIVSEDKPNEIVRLGSGRAVLVSLHHKNPAGIVDHYALGVQNFNRDAVTRQLKDLGLTPEDNLDAGFHVKDPEGMSVQIVAG